jgi:hypothetical protein
MCFILTKRPFGRDGVSEKAENLAAHVTDDGQGSITSLYTNNHYSNVHKLQTRARELSTRRPRAPRRVLLGPQ